MKQPIVLLYSNFESLLRSGLQNQGLVITAQEQVAQAFRSQFIRAFGANKLIELLLSDWHSERRALAQYLLLSRLTASLTAPKKALASALQKGKSDILRALRLFAETGIEPEDLPEATEEEKALKELAQRFFAERDSGVPLLKQQLKIWTQPEKFRRRLQTPLVSKPTASGKKEEQTVVGVPKKVYFQGFYYVKPLQARLIEAMRGLDILVYYVNAWDSAAPEACEVWSENPRFQEDLQERVLNQEPAMRPSPTVIKFRTLFEFSSYLSQSLEEGRETRHVLYAPAGKQANEVVENFFAQEKEKKNLLAYPAGRYLDGIYSMAREDGSIEADPESVRACLATGWASNSPEDTGRLMSVFERVHDYFSDCRFPEQWQERSQRLKKVITDVMPLFHCDTPVGGNEQLHRYLSNPFAGLGPFSVSVKEVDELINAVTRLMADARALLGFGNVNIKLRDHFQVLREILKTKAKVNGTVLTEERAVFEIFDERLQNFDETECLPQQLSEAVRFFLGGKLQRKEDDDVPSALARSLTNIEAAAVLNPDAHIHVCFCDADLLPGQPRAFMWPLGKDYFDRLATKQWQLKNPRANERLRDWLYFVKSTRLSNRWLFHVAEQIPGVVFSWVASRESKILNPSPYLSLMIKTLKLPVIQGSRPIMTQPNLVSDENLTWNFDDQVWDAQQKFGRGSQKLRFPKEFQPEFVACPKPAWRLFYDFGAGRCPCFTERFHIQRFMTVLLALLVAGPIRNLDVASEQLFALYPAFSDVERQQICDFAKRYAAKTGGLVAKNEFEEVNGGTYPMSRLYLERLNVTRLDEIFVGNNGAEESLETCSFCPHRGLCRMTRL